MIMDHDYDGGRRRARHMIQYESSDRLITVSFLKANGMGIIISHTTIILLIILDFIIIIASIQLFIDQHNHY